MLLSMLSAALLAAPFLEPRCFRWLGSRSCRSFGQFNARNISQGGVLRLVHGLCRASDRISLAGHTISAFGGFPYSISAIVFLLYAALQAIQMALFALLVRSVGLGPLSHISCCVLGGARIFISAAFSLARGQTRRCHFVVYPERRSRWTLRRQFHRCLV